MKPSVHLLTLTILAFGLLLTSCDSDETEDEVAPDGTWQAVSDDAVEDYIRINLPSFEVYEETDDCYIFGQSQLERISGNTFSVEGEDNSDTVTLEIEDDILTVTGDNGSTTRFRRSNVDVTAFTLCD